MRGLYFPFFTRGQWRYSCGALKRPVTRPARLVSLFSCPARNLSPSSSPSPSPSPSPPSTIRRPHSSHNSIAYARVQYRAMAPPNPFSTLLNNNTLTARLAVLQPAAEQEAPIELTLTEAVIKDASYECISYDRSAETASAAANNTTTTVSVDGAPQDIPKQLGDALRTFRRKTRPRTLWADVLVGRTPAEMSAQARVQRAVLEGAERTLCWLSSDKGDLTTRAFATIAEMGRRFDEASRGVGLGPDDRLSAATVQQLTGIRERLLSCPAGDLDSFDFALWREISAVFGSAYWQSVQAVADIALAKVPIVVCGRGNIHWPGYIAASRAMPFFQAKFFGVPLLPHVMKGFDIANQIEIAERRRRLGESVELLPMVQTARECGPRDVRDSVFSMVLLATPSRRVEFHKEGPQPLPNIDYGKTPQQVFIETARYTVLERQDLMLWYAERPPCEKRLKGLPTWVPDFGAIPPKVGPLFNPNGGMRQWWDAIKPESAKKPITVSADNALHLQARPLDRIVHVSPIFNGGNARHVLFTEFKKLNEAMSATPNPFSQETREQVGQRFWRTLILNSGGSKSASATMRDVVAPPDSLGHAFASMIAEEAIMHQLDCSNISELQTPENAARLRASPGLMTALSQCGKSKPYEELLAKNSIGRRFFWTQGGRFGMTGIEDVKAIDPHLDSPIGDEAGDGNGKGQDKEEVEKRRQADLGRTMNDPMSRMMMEQFQAFLNERDPNAARIHAKAVRGMLPEVSEDTLGRLDGGVREGDLVVACVGGFFPYILRPQRTKEEAKSEKETETQTGIGEKNAGERTGEGAAEERGDGKSDAQPTEATSEDSSTYEFVGECYLHEAMQGEDFLSTSFFGMMRSFSVDVSKLVDITIV
ncbi:uncharacterized protein F4807DRAFT_433485 [Annulohypoxylon truncatum]|uniref:uncharacterized protein n=1 Tax=Annulohypoxylon truncatum TaxID=327061 RepID=UPI00200888A0|nr:uncharacterized protein F4807DRAFT_433485 [Annulohypoxylon truncatum]KAI1207845.1 hypothetical protein F4807DRAFT_433485 [Annulohypoxylon truncatum]